MTDHCLCVSNVSIQKPPLWRDVCYIKYDPYQDEILWIASMGIDQDWLDLIEAGNGVPTDDLEYEMANRSANVEQCWSAKSGGGYTWLVGRTTYDLRISSSNGFAYKYFAKCYELDGTFVRKVTIGELGRSEQLNYSEIVAHCVDADGNLIIHSQHAQYHVYKPDGNDLTHNITIPLSAFYSTSIDWSDYTLSGKNKLVLAHLFSGQFGTVKEYSALWMTASGPTLVDYDDTFDETSHLSDGIGVRGKMNGDRFHFYIPVADVTNDWFMESFFIGEDGWEHVPLYEIDSEDSVYGIPLNQTMIKNTSGEFIYAPYESTGTGGFSTFFETQLATDYQYQNSDKNDLFDVDDTTVDYIENGIGFTPDGRCVTSGIANSTEPSVFKTDGTRWNSSQGGATEAGFQGLPRGFGFSDDFVLYDDKLIDIRQWPPIDGGVRHSGISYVLGPTDISVDEDGNFDLCIRGMNAIQF